MLSGFTPLLPHCPCSRGICHNLPDSFFLMSPRVKVHSNSPQPTKDDSGISESGSCLLKSVYGSWQTEKFSITYYSILGPKIMLLVFRLKFFRTKIVHIVISWRLIKIRKKLRKSLCKNIFKATLHFIFTGKLT